MFFDSNYSFINLGFFMLYIFYFLLLVSNVALSSNLQLNNAVSDAVIVFQTVGVKDQSACLLETKLTSSQKRRLRRKILTKVHRDSQAKKSTELNNDLHILNKDFQITNSAELPVVDEHQKCNASQQEYFVSRRSKKRDVYETVDFPSRAKSNTNSTIVQQKSSRPIMGSPFVLAYLRESGYVSE